MIAKSDFVILLVSLAILGGGIYRWQTNTGTVPAVTVPASLQSNVRNPVNNRISNPVNNPVNGTGNDSGSVAAVSGNAGLQTITTTTPRIVTEEAAPATVVVNAEAIDATPSVAGTEEASNEPQYGVHQVVYGDYLGRIANRYGTTVSELRQINKLSGSNIVVGQELRYPLPAN